MVRPYVRKKRGGSSLASVLEGKKMEEGRRGVDGEYGGINYHA
jgi:hypothetical protein